MPKWLATGLVAILAAVAVTLVFSDGGEDRRPRPLGASLDINIGPTATATPTPTPAANLWVDTNGGTCTRQGTAGAYSDAGACSTFQAARTAATCGDQIIVKSGGYAAQSITGTKSCSGATTITISGETASSATYRGDEAGVVVVQQIDLGSDATALDDMLFRYMTFSETGSACVRSGSAYSPGGCNNNKMVDMKRTTNVDMDHVSIDRAWIVGDGLGLTRDNVDNDFTWSEAKNGVDNKMIQIQNFGGGSFAVQNLRMENFDCHDQGFSRNTYNVGVDDPHGECLWMTGDSDGMQFINWRCWNSFSTGCINWGGVGGFGGPKNNVTFRNCLMGVAYTFTNGVDIAPGAKVAYRGDAHGSTIQGENTGATGGTFEYCVADGSVDFDAQTVTVRGSVIDSFGCSGGVTYRYVKMTSGSACSGTGNSVSSGAFSGTNFTNITAGDYRPTNGSAVQCGAGDPTSFPAADFFGTSRGNPPDAGLYEC